MDDDSQFDKDNQVSYGKQTKNVYHLWLIDDIGEAKTYMKWFDLLQTATENDLVVFHINCYGGDLYTTTQLIAQIQSCEATVVCQIEGACASAATMVALACQGVLCYPYGFMMIHTSSGFTVGKQSDVKKQEEFYNRWLERLFADVYQDFLTKAEISSILDGHDLWLDSEQVNDRFKRKCALVEKEQARARRRQKEEDRKVQSYLSNLQHAAADDPKAIIQGVVDDAVAQGQADRKKAKRAGRKPQRKAEGSEAAQG